MRRKVFLGINPLGMMHNKKSPAINAGPDHSSRMNLSLAGCSSAEPVSVSVQHHKIQINKLYLQPVKNCSHLPMHRAKSFIKKFYPTDAILKTFIKGAFWSVYGNVVVKGSSLIASIFIARLLGSGSFGELSIIKTTLSVFSLFATFGLGVTVTKFVAENRIKNREEIRTTILAANVITAFTGTILGLLLIGFASIISVNILHSENLTIPLMISGIFLFFNALTVCQVGIISGLGAFRELAKINFIVGVITLPVLIGFTYFFGLNGTLIGLTINLIITWYLNKFLIKGNINHEISGTENSHSENRLIDQLRSHKGLKKKIANLLKFSYPLAIKEIIYSLSNWLCFYLLLTKTNYEQVGIFNSANQLSQLILFLPASMSTVFLSLLSNRVSEKADYNYLIKKNILITILVTVGIGVGMSLFSGVIYKFYGDSFIGGEPILYVLVAAAVPMSLVGICEQIFISSSKPKLVTASQFVIQLLIVVSAIIFFSIDGSAISLAYSFLTGYSIAAAMMYVFMWQIGLIGNRSHIKIIR